MFDDLFGGDDISSNQSQTNTTKNGKNNEEMDEKTKAKIKNNAAREIKRIIHSIPDLSFLKSIKLYN